MAFNVVNTVLLQYGLTTAARMGDIIFKSYWTPQADISLDMSIVMLECAFNCAYIILSEVDAFLSTFATQPLELEFKGWYDDK